MPDDPLKVRVQFASGDQITLAELIDAWGGHVARLAEESTQPETRETWGAHDFFAALHLRDCAERALRVHGGVEDLARSRLRPHDELPVSFTERDSGHLVRRFGEEPTTLGWWWDRIPRTGLVRGDLEHWLATTIGEMTSRE